MNCNCVIKQTNVVVQDAYSLPKTIMWGFKCNYIVSEYWLHQSFKYDFTLCILKRFYSEL